MQIYDNGGKTFDRYCVIIGDEVYEMSDNAKSPNGFNQYCCRTDELRPDRNVLGKEVRFEDLPLAVKQAIQDRKR